MDTGNPVFARILPDIIRNHGSLEKNPQLIAGLRNYYKEPEIISLLIELLKHKSFKVRRSAADILVNITKTDFSRVSENWKQTSKLISEKHIQKWSKPDNHSDGISSSDCSGHYDNSNHLDTGIGLELPSELQGAPVKNINLTHQ